MRTLLTTAAVAALSLTLLGSAPALGSPSALESHPTAAHRATNPSVAAKTALLKGVAKIERYTAKHGGLPTDKRGGKLLRTKAAKGMLTTYRTVSGPRAGYCATASAKAQHSKKAWVHDSWLNKTWRATPRQMVKAGGACAAVSEQPGPGHAKDEKLVAISDAYEVVDAVDRYEERDDTDGPPPAIDATFLAEHGATLTPGSTVVGYVVYDPENWNYRFCLVRDSGAWATYDEDELDIVHAGTTGAACTY